jgi:hypothetical protein
MAEKPKEAQITKRCSRCHKDISINDFYKKKSGAMGLDCYCKKCRTIQGRRWCRKNKKRHSELNANWYKNNKAAHAAYMKRWCEDNKVKHNENTREWRKNNPEKIKAIKERYLKKIKERKASDVLR